MSLPDTSFKVVEDSNCSLYEIGDEFRYSGNTLALPHGRVICLTLAEDIKRVLKPENSQKSHDTFCCSGCSGHIRLAYRQGGKSPPTDADDIGTIASLLNDFSFFQPLEEADIRELVSYLKLRKFDKGEYVIKKGEPGTNLFIIIFGTVEVVGDRGVSLAFMGKGEVFGEMSLLSGEPVGATIKVVRPATILYISGKDFRNVLAKTPSLQTYFTRLLARRLTERNIVRTKEFSSGMVGQLSEMPPSELFQALNLNQKTGSLSLQLSKGAAVVSFREGELVRAEYEEQDGKEAFYDMLKEKEGRFKFTSGLSEEETNAEIIGDFMWLLMEGVRRMDEELENMKEG